MKKKISFRIKYNVLDVYPDKENKEESIPRKNHENLEEHGAEGVEDCEDCEEIKIEMEELFEPRIDFKEETPKQGKSSVRLVGLHL